MEVLPVVNSTFVVGELYLKSTLSTNLPHHKCAHWNNHRMWMLRSVNAIKANWRKNWENYLTALIQLGWRLLTHSLCFPAPQEVLWHQPALLHAVRSSGPPVPLPPTVQDSPTSTKTSASWLQLEAFITAAHQAWQRDVVHIYPACYILSLSSHVHGSSTPPATFHSAVA